MVSAIQTKSPLPFTTTCSQSDDKYDPDKLVLDVEELARSNFAPRAACHDQNGSFPRENFDDLRRAGLLALCIPREYGGLGADFPTYARVSTAIAKHCAATAFTFNMHSCNLMWIGMLADQVAMQPAERRLLNLLRTRHYKRVVEDGAIFAQPISEGGPGVSVGTPYSTSAKPVPGGWVITGRKIFASLAGEADYYGTACTEVGGTDTADTLYLAVAADSNGIKVIDDDDLVGMRGTVSRTIIFDNVFVPHHDQLMPRGVYHRVTQIWPHMFLTLTPTFLGIAEAAYNFTLGYLRGTTQGDSNVEKTVKPIKQFAVAEMFILLEQMRALFDRAFKEAHALPTHEQRMRAWACQYTIMEQANEICQRAIRTCGGRCLLQNMPLERYFRDARCGAVLRPWSADRCLELLGEAALSDEF